MSQISPAIRFRDVCFSYGEGDILSGFMLSVAAGDFLCLIGPSGSGKTTLLRLINGLEKPRDGAVEIFGCSPDFARQAGQLSFVPQQASLLPWMNVFHNVALPFSLRGKTVPVERVKHVLNQVGLIHAIDKKPRELSGGMQARVALARAWVDDQSSILLMDEPFASLDEMRREELGELLKSLWSDGSKTIVYVTHHISEAILLGNRILPFGAFGSARSPSEWTIPVTSDDLQAERALRRSPMHERLRLLLETRPESNSWDDIVRIHSGVNNQGNCTRKS